MRRSRQLLLPATALGAIAVIAACSGNDQTGDDSIKSAHVELALFNANGMKAGTCSGVLVSPTRVLTAGHCVIGFAKWRVTSPGAQASVTAQKAFTYDWETTIKSQPKLHDVAVVMLDEPIPLREYPTIATKGLQSTPAVRMRNVGGEFEPVSTTATSATSLGFNHHYALKLDKSETLVTGGALMTADNRMVLGIVHGQGATSGTLYATRVDATLNWIGDRLRCTSKMAPVGAAIACYKSDAGVCLEHGPDCPNSKRDAGGARGDGTNQPSDELPPASGGGGTPSTGSGTPGTGTGSGGSGSGSGAGGGGAGGANTGTGGAGSSAVGQQFGTPGSCDERTLLPGMPVAQMGTPIGSGAGGTGTGSSGSGAPGTSGSGGTGAGTGTGSGSGSGSGSGGTGAGSSGSGAPGTSGSGGDIAGSGSGSGSGVGGAAAGSSVFGFPGIGPGGAFKAQCHGAACGSLPGNGGASGYPGGAANPGTPNVNGGSAGGAGAAGGGASAGSSGFGAPGTPGAGGLTGSAGGFGSGGFGSSSGFGGSPGLPSSGGVGSGGSGSGAGAGAAGSAGSASGGTPGAGGAAAGGSAGSAAGGTGAGGSASGSAGVPGSGATGTTATTTDGITREGPGCYGIASCVDQIVNYGTCCADPGIGGTSATAPTPIK